jgi:hypothetical protein
MGIYLFMREYSESFAVGHVFFELFVCDLFCCGPLDFTLFDQSLALLRYGVDSQVLDASDMLILVLDVCLIPCVNDRAGQAVFVHGLTNSDGHAVLPDSSTRDMLVDERARCTERAEHAILPASIAGLGGGAVAARATKQMTVIAPATESDRGWMNAWPLTCGGAVAHVSTRGLA